MKHDDTWLTLEEAAKHLKIIKSTICRHARDGRLPAHRVGVCWWFNVDELDEWLKSGKFVLPKENEVRTGILNSTRNWNNALSLLRNAAETKPPTILWRHCEFQRDSIEFPIGYLNEE